VDVKNAITAYPKSEVSQQLDLNSESIYFTVIDQEKLTLEGYQIRNGWVPVKIWQLKLEDEGEKVLKISTQHQTASDVEHQHYLPTSFIGDNIIYKYLDSNLFAITLANQLNNTLSIYVINGVSGKVVHLLKESGVAVKMPINVVISENYCVASFMRISRVGMGIPQQMLSVTEFYHQLEEIDTVKLLKEFYL